LEEGREFKTGRVGLFDVGFGEAQSLRRSLTSPLARARERRLRLSLGGNSR